MRYLQHTREAAAATATTPAAPPGEGKAQRVHGKPTVARKDPYDKGCRPVLRLAHTVRRNLEVLCTLL